MTLLDVVVNSPWLRSLGWTLLHFLWQGAAVGLCYGLVRHGLRSRSPELRYCLAMITLVVLAALPVCTFLYLLHTNADVEPAVRQAAMSIITPAGSFIGGAAPTLLAQLRTLLNAWVPWVTPLWLLGVSFVALRVACAWLYTVHLRTAADFVVPPIWEERFKTLCWRLRIRLPVQIAISRHVTVPSVIGWLKPLVLVPLSALAGLTLQQAEFIMIHELMHIRRQDYLWNLLQTMIEALLFYHPVVRWISHDARFEREQCCDDAVLRLGGGAVEYARTLTELETLRSSRAELVLGATGGQLVARIHRLIGQPAGGSFPVWLPLLLMGMLLSGIGLAEHAARMPVVTALSAERYTATGQAWQPQAQAAPVRLTPSAVQPPALQLRQPRSVAAPVAMLLGAAVPLPAVLPVTAEPLSVMASSQPMAHPVPEPKVPQAPPVRVVSSTVPVYPAFAQERGVQGSATVEFMLGANGDVTNPRVTHVTGSRLFGSAAVRALRRWKFAMPHNARVSRPRTLSITFQFQLRGVSASSQTCHVPIGYHTCVG